MLQRGPNSLHRVVLPHDSSSHYNNHDHFFTGIAVSLLRHFPSVTIVRPPAATCNVYLLPRNLPRLHHFMYQSAVFIQIRRSSQNHEILRVLLDQCQNDSRPMGRLCHDLLPLSHTHRNQVSDHFPRLHLSWSHLQVFLFQLTKKPICVVSGILPARRCREAQKTQHLE